LAIEPYTKSVAKVKCKVKVHTLDIAPLRSEYLSN